MANQKLAGEAYNLYIRLVIKSADCPSVLRERYAKAIERASRRYDRRLTAWARRINGFGSFKLTGS